MTSTSTDQRDPLSASSLLTYIASSLTIDAEPQLRTPTDAIAIACHAGMLAVNFRLVGLSEDHQTAAQSESESPAPLPREWNATAGSYAFRYAHIQSSMQYALKVSRLGPKTVIYGIGVGDNKTTSFDITTNDYTSEAALPASPRSENLDDAVHSIQNIFISPSRLTDLGKALRLNIIQKLIPSLQKEGYEEMSASSTSTGQQRQNPPPHPRDPVYDPPTRDPLHDDPLLPRPAQPHNPLADPSVGPRRGGPIPDFPAPGFEDEFEMQRGPRGVGRLGGHQGGPLADYGQDDLYPPGFGPRDPLRIGPESGGGMAASLRRPNQGCDAQRPAGARWDPVTGGEDDFLGGGPNPMSGLRGGPHFGGPRGNFGGSGGGFGSGNPFGGLGGGDLM